MLGVVLGGSVIFCILFDNFDEVKFDIEKVVEDDCCLIDDGDKFWYNCLVCGMG